MMKKQILLFASAFLLLASCSKQEDEGSTTKEENYDWTITFESCGGSEVSPIHVKDGEKAKKPANPTQDGYSFQDWYIDDFLTVTFDWETPITSDWVLYAGWKEVVEPSSSEDSSIDDPIDSSSTSSKEETSKGHGPEGSTLTSWYLVGSGSLWGSDGWTTKGGVQLYTNPGNEYDKGCILGITLKVGDIFKVTDGGSTWFGYEKVDKASTSSNLGLTNFAADNDGAGGNNFKCIVEGSYDMYINSSGVFWIQAAA